MKKAIIFSLSIFFFACSNSKEDQVPADPNSTEIISEPEETALPKKVFEPVVRDLDALRKDKSIKVILTNSPISYFIYKGEPMGFQYDFAARLAKDLDLDIEVVIAESIPEAIEMLLSGQGDMIASGLTINEERTEIMDFSKRLYSTHQVLVQRKPDNWKKISRHNLNGQMTRDVLDLENSTIHVKKGSSFKHRISNLSSEIGAPINIIERPDSISTEDLMKEVSEGKIMYTIADDNTAALGELFYDNLDIQTQVSFSQQIAWAIRKESPMLVEAMNKWIEDAKKSGLRNILYNKYFGESRSVERRLVSPYTFIENGKLSPYDDIIKEKAKEINWDWRLLAAQIFKESKFNPKAKSWVGARGLMQLMPRTAAAYHISNLTDPYQSIHGGTRHILWLTDLFDDKIEDPEERQKFIIGSYNVGQGHVFDAQRLAQKFGKDPQKWDDVAEFLLKKSNSKYYRDPVVKYGYCRGIEVVTYVERIYEIYDLYKGLIQE